MCTILKSPFNIYKSIKKLSKAPSMQTAEYWIKKLNLIEHPTAGYYAETYRSSYHLTLSNSSDIRCAHSSIYYLLKSGQIGYWRRMKSDETFHFYAGHDLLIYTIHQNGNLKLIKCGHTEQDENALPQLTISANTWFALEVSTNKSYSLVGCSVTPGFDFQDYELPDKSMLLKLFPQHQQLIERLGFNGTFNYATKH